MRAEKLKTILLAVVGLGLYRRRRPARLGRDVNERIVPAGQPEPHAEYVAIALLLVGALCAIGFVVVYALDRLPHSTQLLGLSLGLSCLSVAAALIVIAKRLVVDEELTESYPELEHADDQEAISQILAESGSRFTRRRLVKLTLGATGAAIAAAALTPLLSLGPVFDVSAFYRTPWRRGRRLVDEHGNPYHVSDIEQDDLYTAFPEGADKESLGSSIVLVRLPQHLLDLPPANARYAADGIVAYSKICTHAGCAVSLYRAPLYQPDEPRPALVCPCHYSTFDPARAGEVEFGPAGRKLPMLPLTVSRTGELRAGGTFDSPVGPSWWGVRTRKPTA